MGDHRPRREQLPAPCAYPKEPDDEPRFHLYTDQTEEVAVVGRDILTHDGHCTYSPDVKWILTDGYPGKERMQRLLLLRLSDSKLFTLGKFYLSTPPSIDLRCDLHPRWSRDGKYVCIDSAHENAQRQIYLLDVSRIVSSVD